MIIIFVYVKRKHNMSLEQEKKDLLVMRAMLKKQIEKLTFIQEQTGIKTEKQIDKLLDRLTTIDKILEELNKK